jgi:hypothetical protein
LNDCIPHHRPVKARLHPSRLAVIAIAIQNEQKFLRLPSSGAPKGLLEIGNHLLGIDVVALRGIRVAAHDPKQERHELRALGVLVVAKPNHLAQKVFGPVRSQRAGSQIDSAIFRVQRPRVLIKIARTGLPHFLLCKMHHIRERGTRQRAIHEFQERLAFFPIWDVLRVGEGFKHRFFGPFLGF